MERSTRFTGLPAAACLAAGALAIAASILSSMLGADFTGDYPGVRHALLSAIWGGTAFLSGVLVVALSVVAGRRRNQPAWSALARRVVVATLPGLYVGAVLTEFARRSGRHDLLPALWSLCYGASLLGLGLYAGWKANVAGALFLVAGTLSLLGAAPGGNLLMGLSFGGIHVLLGLLILGGSAHAPEDRVD